MQIYVDRESVEVTAISEGDNAELRYEIKGKQKVTRDRYIDDLKREIARAQRSRETYHNNWIATMKTLDAVTLERDEYQRGAAVTEGERDHAREELEAAIRENRATMEDRLTALRRIRKERNQLREELESCKQGQVRAEKQWQHVGHTEDGASVAAAPVGTPLCDATPQFNEPSASEIPFAEIQSYEAPRVVRVVTTYEYSDGTTSEIG